MRRFRPRLLPTLATLPALLILLGLGTWQVERLQWKNDLIATISARMAADPVPLPDAAPVDPGGLTWLKVKTLGTFVTPPGDEQVYGVENIDGVLGSRLLGVFQTSSGRSLLVDRGYTPQSGTPPPEPSGVVEVEAVLRDRGSDHQAWFVPDNDPDTGRWYWLDVAALGRKFGHSLEPVALQLLPGSPGATPKAAAPVIDLPNNHLGYAITWYGLALALMVVFVAFSSERTEQRS